MRCEFVVRILKAQGLATERLSTAASRENPVIALTQSAHRQVNAAQRLINAAAQGPIENINANAGILLSLGIDPSWVAQVQQRAIEHAQKFGF